MQNNFKKFKKIPFIAAVVFLAVSILVFTWLKGKINANNGIVADREAELQAETRKKEETELFGKMLKTIEAERAMLDSHFIKSSDVVIFLDAVENLAPKVGAEAEVTQVDIAPDNRSLTVSMHAQGSFEELHKFIKLLENAEYQIEFVSMDLQRVGAVAASTSGEDGTIVAPSVVWSAVFKIKLLSFLP
jgi:hypothetical protein